MNLLIKNILLSIFFLWSINVTCQENTSDVIDKSIKVKKKKKSKRIRLPQIDLNHWSVTTPELNQKGKATSVYPPDILDYATDDRLIKYMYNDSIAGALVFYAYPSNATTANTKYSRCELREQMQSGSNDVNWTFAQKSIMKGRLQVAEISKDSQDKYHKVIIMQIHGRLTNEQRDLIGQKDNNAPPILKIYWQKGKIRVKTKVLKNLGASDKEILHKDAWGDHQGYTFPEEVGFKPFTLEVIVNKNKMKITLNNNETKVYNGVHMKKWGVFENYFKAGNYFQSRDKGAYAKVKYYQLEVTH